MQHWQQLLLEVLIQRLFAAQRPVKILAGVRASHGIMSRHLDAGSIR